jgi:DNA polymerase-3 subunit delta
MGKDGPTINDLMKSISRTEIAPVYLLYGDEDFLIEEGVGTLTNAVLGEGERGFNLDVVSAADRDIREIVAIATSFPMMADRRVVVVRDAEKVTGRDADVLTNYCENPSRSTCLILVATKADFRKKPYQTIKRSGMAFEAKTLYDNQLPPWITSRVQRGGKLISPDACKLLAAYVGTSLREVQNELEKLSIYIGERKEITTDDVAAVVGMSKEYSIFELQKAIGTRDLRRSIEIVQHMMESGENVPFILIMLTNYFTALWKLCDMRRKGVPPRDQASEARIHPYFFQEYAEALNRFAPSEIEGAFLLLAAADEQAKLSVDPLQIMSSLIVQLLGQEEFAFSV